jgi:hypothetical protein
VVHRVVGDARLRVVAARAHLVVGDGHEPHLVAGEADRGDVPLVRVHAVLVEPDVAGRRVVVELVLVLGAPEELQAGEPVALDARAPIPETLGQPGLPEVGRLDHVVIDRDDHRDLGRGVGRGGLRGGGGHRSSEGGGPLI